MKLILQNPNEYMDTVLFGYRGMHYPKIMDIDTIPEWKIQTNFPKTDAFLILGAQTVFHKDWDARTELAALLLSEYENL